MKKTIKTVALCALATSTVFAAPDDYQKKSSDPYGDGVILKAGAEFVEFVQEATEHINAEHKVEITVQDIDGQDVRKVIRYRIDGYIGENERADKHHSWYSDTGLLKFSIALRAENGEDVTIEEAKLAFAQIQGNDNGLTAQIVEYAQENGMHFTTKAVEEIVSANLLNLRLSDNVYTFENGDSLVFNGFVKAGWVADITAYGQDLDADISDNTKIEYGAAAGYKFKNLMYGANVTPEAYQRTSNFNGDNDFSVTRTGFQVAIEKAFAKTTCSAAIGYAEEEVEGQFTEELDEIYIQTKCEF